MATKKKVTKSTKKKATTVKKRRTTTTTKRTTKVAPNVSGIVNTPAPTTTIPGEDDAASENYGFGV
jgi:hypothetical protein